MIWSGRGAIGALVVAAQVFLLAGCAGSGTPTPAGTPVVTLELGTQNIAFDPVTLTAPADVVFAIDFDNRESALHNVTIRRAGTIYYQGELLSGPGSRTYVVPPLPAGQYEFICDIHPEMVGTLTSQ